MKGEKKRRRSGRGGGNNTRGNAGHITFRNEQEKC